MLYYVPLPAYKERYSEYLSCKDGIFETYFKQELIPLTVIRPSDELFQIKKGLVLDPSVMVRWSFAQTTEIVDKIMNGTIVADDVIYFEDFWHAGMEMIPYALSLLGLTGKVRLMAFCHAQSVDKNDFTAKLMMPWIRGFENAWVACLDTIFVAAPELREMCRREWDLPFNTKKVIAIGTIFSSSYLREYLTKNTKVKVEAGTTRLKEVVYSSRLDIEKDPYLLIAIAERVMDMRPDICFSIVTGAYELRSSDPGVVRAIYNLRERYDGFHIRLSMPKWAYYYTLARCAVQLNTAEQDFVSYTLLEATTFGCVPFYPRQLTFPDAIGHSKHLLYYKNKLAATADALISLVDYSSTRQCFSGIQKSLVWAGDHDNEFNFVHRKYDHSLNRLVYSRDISYGQDFDNTSKLASMWDEKFEKFLAERKEHVRQEKA